MGMYTEIAIGVEFRPDTPQDVIDTISAMVRGEGPFDDCRMWMLNSGGSYYFDAKPCLVWEFDDIPNAWFLTVWTNIKNYEGELEWLLGYIAPHLESDGYIGHMRYEENDDPTLLYARDGVIGAYTPHPLAGVVFPAPVKL